MTEHGQASAAGGGAGPGPGPGLRLHPWSWLFVLLAQLRSFAVPLLALLLFGRGDAQWMQWELLGGAAGGLLALSSVVQYFTYRYGVIGTDLVIRAGLLQRHTRNIPLARIRNVSLHRSVLHRLFGVAEVRLESAGGARAEAHMRVLSLAAAAELERLVQSGATAAAAGTGIGAAGTGSGAAAGDRGEQLLALPIAELVRLGLISNRGMVVVGAGFAALWQLAPGDAGDWIEAVGEWLLGRASALQLGTLATAVGVAVLVAAAVAVLRLLSIVLALVQFHGFRLRLGGEAISVERGLLTHVRGHAPVRKIQHWTVTETLLHRLLRRCSLAVETAVSQGGSGGNEGARSIHHLVPVATLPACAALVQRLLPAAGALQFDWQPLHPRAWRRMCFWPLLLTLLATAVLAFQAGPAALALLLLVPAWVWRARRLAAASGWALGAELIAYRSGWLDRRISFAELAKLQGVRVLHTPFDRRRGMATLSVDTAGASPLGHRIHVRYLPEPVARQLAAELGRRIGRSPLAW